MRTFFSKRPLTFLLISLALLGTILACNLPMFSQMDASLSQEEALQLVLDEIIHPDQLGEDPLVVFAWPEVLGPEDVLHPYYILGEDSDPGLVIIEARSWFFWIEDEPYAHFAHPSRFVLVEIESGEISSSDQNWWPVLNGEDLWTENDEYQDEENWAWTNVSFIDPEDTSGIGSSSIMAAIFPPQIRPAQTEGGTRKALVINTFAKDQSGPEDGVEDAANMLRILERTDFKTTYLGTDYDDNNKKSGVPFTEGGGKNNDVNDPWRKWLRSQADEMKSGDTLVVYATGHSDGGGVGGSFLLNNNGILGSNELEAELKEFDPGVDIIVIVQSCKSGGFVRNLDDVANLIMSATDREGESYGDIDFRYLIHGIATGVLANFDLNPNDKGSEYTSSLVAGWEKILDDPDLLEKVKQKAKDMGISFMDALISEAYEQGRKYDMAVRKGLSDPQKAFGSNKGRQKTPEGSPDTTNTTPDNPSEDSASATSGDSEQACAVFEQVEIVDTIMRHMRDCNPTLNFYYKLDSAVPGLASASPTDLDYWVSVNGTQGNCFLEEGFDDRLYCRLDISPAEANTLGHFKLYANPCQEPISALDLTIPELEGCGDGEPQTESEDTECDSEE